MGYLWCTCGPGRDLPANCRLLEGLPEGFAFPDGQGDEVAVGGEVDDDVAAVGVDGVEKGGLGEAVAGDDGGFGFDEHLDGLEVADAGGLDEWGALVGVFGVDGCAVFEEEGDAIAVVFVQRPGGGAKEFEQGREAVGAAAIGVGAGLEGFFEEVLVRLLDRLEELLVGVRDDRGRRDGLGGSGGEAGGEQQQCGSDRDRPGNQMRSRHRIHELVVAQAAGRHKGVSTSGARAVSGPQQLAGGSAAGRGRPAARWQCVAAPRAPAASAVESG